VERSSAESLHKKENQRREVKSCGRRGKRKFRVNSTLSGLSTSLKHREKNWKSPESASRNVTPFNENYWKKNSLCGNVRLVWNWIRVT